MEGDTIIEGAEVPVVSKEEVSRIIKEFKNEFPDYEWGVKMSTLGGADKASYFISVFGPKDTWKNGIALNSPLGISFYINGSSMEQSKFSYQLKNAGMKKFRKAKVKNAKDIKTKISQYLNKNKEQIQKALGES